MATPTQQRDNESVAGTFDAHPWWVLLLENATVYTCSHLPLPQAAPNGLQPSTGPGIGDPWFRLSDSPFF